MKDRKTHVRAGAWPLAGFSASVSGLQVGQQCGCSPCPVTAAASYAPAAEG